MNLRYYSVIFVLLLCTFISTLDAQTIHPNVISDVEEYLKLAENSPSKPSKMRGYLDAVKNHFDQIQYEDKQKAEIRKLIQNYKILEAIYAKETNNPKDHKRILEEIEKDIKFLSQRNLRDSINMSIVYRSLSSFYGESGNLAKQELYGDRSESWYRTEASRYAYLAELCIKKENYSQAKIYAEKALGKAKSGTDIYSSVSYMLTYIYVQENKIDKALYYLDLDNNNLSFDSTKYAVRRSQIYCLQRDFESALGVINKALKRIKNTSSFSVKYDDEASELFIERGEIYFKQGLFKPALEDFQKGIVYLIPDFIKEEPSENPEIKPFYDNLNILNAFNKKIKALDELRKEDVSYTEICLNTTIESIDLMDLIRRDFMADEDQHLLVEKSYKNYKLAFELAYLKGAFRQAFEISERSKSITLYDKLRTNLATYSPGGDNASSRINYLKKKIAENKGKLLSAKKELLDSIELEIKNAELEVDSLNRELEKRPEVQKILNQLEIASFENIKKKLSYDEMMLHFFETDNHLYAFLFDGKNLIPHLQRIDLNDSLREAIKEFNQTIYKEGNQYNTSYAEYAHLIYQKLFYQPFFEKQKLPEKLIVVPDGALNNLAFDALLVKPIEKSENIQNFKLHNYFGTKVAWAFWPSASIGLDFLKEDVDYLDHQYKLLTYAPAFDENKTDYIDGKEIRLSNLIFSKGEIDSVDRIMAYPDSLVLSLRDSLATKDHFILNCLKASIIHIASHGVVLNAKNSFIAFSNVSGSIDYKLTIDNIHLLNLSAKMIVASACKTGIGEQVKGEGMISISRALIYAGSKSVVYSLWEIDDDSTKELIEFFYKELNAGNQKHIAMRNAKKQFVEKADSDEHAHPKYWASLVPSGSMVPLSNNGNNQNSKFLKGMLALLFIGLCFFSIRFYRHSSG